MTHFSEHVPVIKQCMTVFLYIATSFGGGGERGELGWDPRASGKLGKRSTTELHPQPVIQPS